MPGAALPFGRSLQKIRASRRHCCCRVIHLDFHARVILRHVRNNNLREACSMGYRVMESLSTETQGRALFPDIPSDSKEEFDAAVESEKAHGRSTRSITLRDECNGRGLVHRETLPCHPRHQVSYSMGIFPGFLGGKASR